MTTALSSSVARPGHRVSVRWVIRRGGEHRPAERLAVPERAPGIWWPAVAPQGREEEHLVQGIRAEWPRSASSAADIVMRPPASSAAARTCSRPARSRRSRVSGLLRLCRRTLAGRQSHGTRPCEVIGSLRHSCWHPGCPAACGFAGLPRSAAPGGADCSSALAGTPARHAGYNAARSASTSPPQMPCRPAVAQCRIDTSKHSARSGHWAQRASAPAASSRARSGARASGNQASGSMLPLAHFTRGPMSRSVSWRSLRRAGPSAGPAA